jgi:hypothetical protein
MPKTEENPDAGKSPVRVNLYAEDEEMLIEVVRGLF